MESQTDHRVPSAQKPPPRTDADTNHRPDPSAPVGSGPRTLGGRPSARPVDEEDRRERYAPLRRSSPVLPLAIVGVMMALALVSLAVSLPM